MSDFPAFPSHLARPIAAALLPLLASACGLVTAGTSTQNDPVPPGSIVSQGNFTGVNGRAVTGTVAVYQTLDSGGNCQYIVRLQNLSAPTDGGLQVIPVVSGAASLSPSFYVLRAPTGNENYYYSTSSSACSATFAQVEISNPAVSPASAQNYGIATLTAI
jgi:hypothetical protein